MKRREFNRICSTLALSACGALPSTVIADSRRDFSRSELRKDKSTPMHATQLETGVPYVFFYPYAVTPCFLVDLGHPVTKTIDIPGSQPYTWKGGVGPNQSIVAYSAICSHKMSHPAREISFINYRHDETDFFNRDGNQE